MRFLLIIPAFNEEDNLPKVASDIGELINHAVVINDGSTDRTSDVAKALGFVVLDHPFNIGIGGAVQTGLKYALREGYEIAIQFDGDFQHRADQITNITKPLFLNGADLIIGSRVLAGDYKFPLLRKIGMKWFSLLIWLISGIKITDPTSGFRCYGKRAIEFFSVNYPEDYPEVESIIYAKKFGLRLKEAPAFMRKRVSGRSSIGALNAIYYMIKVTIGVIMASIRKVRGV